MILAGGTDSEKIDLLEVGLTKIFGAQKRLDSNPRAEDGSVQVETGPSNRFHVVPTPETAKQN